ncbi:MAG TPA: hypothetical protein VHQ65_12100 [Thermoanaerobaculia bacterium]|nr:hypothetical protein [Thermoanaerobaculia bacterium]
MAAPVLQLGCTVQCPHGGMATPVNSNTRVRLGGAFALLAADPWLVAGCPLNVAGAPHPCLTVEWSGAAQKVTVDGQPVLLATSVGLCKAGDGLVQGPALVSGAQTRVLGS